MSSPFGGGSSSSSNAQNQNTVNVTSNVSLSQTIDLTPLQKALNALAGVQQQTGDEFIQAFTNATQGQQQQGQQFTQALQQVSAAQVASDQAVQGALGANMQIQLIIALAGVVLLLLLRRKGRGLAGFQVTL